MFSNLKKSFFAFLNSPRIFSGDLEKFENLFKQSQDPWNFANSPYEKKRFKMIMKIVNSIKPQSILELGCAEGHLTGHLLSTCCDITAVDISKTALRRAEQMVPGVKFVLGDFTKINFTKKFSLILAPEVLYYLKETELIRFLENCHTDYLITTGFWNQGNLLRKCDLKKIKGSWIFRLESGFPFLKITNICLWKKYQSI